MERHVGLTLEPSGDERLSSWKKHVPSEVDAHTMLVHKDCQTSTMFSSAQGLDDMYNQTVLLFHQLFQYYSGFSSTGSWNFLL
jgi:hypothetical protein